MSERLPLDVTDDIPDVRPSDRCATPPEVFDPLNAEFHFTVDVCAERSTAKCMRYFTAAMDGLAQSWAGETIWLNPPYSDPTPWLRKAHESAAEGAMVVALIKLDPTTRWWRDYVEGKAEIRPLPRRVRFRNPDGTAPKSSAAFPCAVIVYRPPGPDAGDDARGGDA